jgi:hypothetical protein
LCETDGYFFQWFWFLFCKLYYSLLSKMVIYFMTLNINIFTNLVYHYFTGNINLLWVLPGFSVPLNAIVYMFCLLFVVYILISD